MVQIASVSPVLLVADVFETAEYYRDVLGFHFDQIYGEPPSFVIVERDGARLMFRQPREGAPQPFNAAVTPNFPADVSSMSTTSRRWPRSCAAIGPTS